MSTGIPPSPYFDNINFNPNFFKVVQTYLTEAIANLKYLKLIGGTLTGFLGIGRAPRVGLDVNGKAIIDTGTNTAPANGQFGSNGTRIILYDGSSTEPPYALGINTNTLWYGTSSTGSHRFYTGTNERLVINSSGLVGVGTTDPKSKITINATPTQTGSVFDYSLSPITITNTTPTSTSVLNDPVPVLYLCREGTASQSYASKATFNLCRYENSGINSRTRLDLALTNDAFNDVSIMSIRSDGRVGIGTTSPSALLDVYSDSSSLNNYFNIRANAARECGIFLTRPGGLWNLFNKGTGFGATQANNLSFQSSSTSSILEITQSGYVGIGTNDPGSNILQVGSGGRLKLASTDTADYSLIGVNNVDNSNNTRIKISGITRVGFNGAIEYVATTATGFHKFYTNNTTEIINMTPDDFQISTSCSTYGGNYYTDGEYLVNMPKTNTAGTTKTGYFYTTEFFINSIVMFAISHNDSTYSYWHGHIGTNNSTQILYLTAINQSNITIENFVEQTTNKTYIYMKPTSSYNASVQMRIKFYG